MSVLHYDLCVIGGGINGAGIARDAAGRGLSVLLVEAQDLAGATSSASTKLIHGGLRYLENYEFSMVRGALREREVLYKSARHLIKPIECILPHDDNIRPDWIVKAGLFFYDNLWRSSTFDRSRALDFSKDSVCKPLSRMYSKAFAYADCWGDDTRLVISNALSAAFDGAHVMNYTSCVGLTAQGNSWRVNLRDERSGCEFDIVASMVANATGPWVNRFLGIVGAHGTDHDIPHVRLVKGSHVILPKLYDGEQAYVLQQDDGRVVFVAPYEGKYTLVGTTEVDIPDCDPRDVIASKCEIAYLVSAVNKAFELDLPTSSVIFTFSGVRPLINDGKYNHSKSSRDYKLYHHNRFEPAMISVFGGKLTTYRALSEDVINKFMQISGQMPSSWTAKSTLAGGDVGEDFDEFINAQQRNYFWAPRNLIYRYARSYGTRMDYFLNGCQKLADLGAHYGDDVYEREIEYLLFHEWATSAEDIIWRRSKMGVYVSEGTVKNIENAVREYFFKNTHGYADSRHGIH